MVVELLGDWRQPVDQIDRSLEVAALESLADRVALPLPALEPSQALPDLVFAQGAILVSVRIASLVPSATEMLFALGLGDSVCGVTHECDYPPEAQGLPDLTRSVIPEGLSAGRSTAPRERTGRRGPLRARRGHPELARCRAGHAGRVRGLRRLVRGRLRRGRASSTQPRISLDPGSLGEVLADLPRLGAAAGAPAAGTHAAEQAGERIAAVEAAVAARHGRAWRRSNGSTQSCRRPVPQMIELAGGEDVLGRPGERSRPGDWEEVARAAPEVVVSMPCGLYAEQAAAETMRHAASLAPLGARVIAVDAAAYFSRPGPRLVEGIELLGHLLHPGLVEPLLSRRSIELELANPA